MVKTNSYISAQEQKVEEVLEAKGSIRVDYVVKVRRRAKEGA